MPSQPIVFISYAWESDAFRAQVKALCDYLRANGVAVVADFDHDIQAPVLGWPAWMQQSIEDAAVVLVVCSASYKPRFEKRAPPTSGKGVAWEGAVITQDLYNAAQRNNKFYPIFPDPFCFDHCPKALELGAMGMLFHPNKGMFWLWFVRAWAYPLHLRVIRARWPPIRSILGNLLLQRAFLGAMICCTPCIRRWMKSVACRLWGDRRIGKTSLLPAHVP